MHHHWHQQHHHHHQHHHHQHQHHQHHQLNEPPISSKSKRQGLKMRLIQRPCFLNLSSCSIFGCFLSSHFPGSRYPHPSPRCSTDILLFFKRKQWPRAKPTVFFPFGCLGELFGGKRLWFFWIPLVRFTFTNHILMEYQYQCNFSTLLGKGRF